MLVPCPNCGPRNSADLRYVGESQVRPDPATASPRQWRSYLYLRRNPAGPVTEIWFCRYGCRRYFSAVRDTSTNEFREHPLPGAKSAAVDPSFHYVSESKTDPRQS
ncbi:MAG: sarcosine oxidase subunit delta [Acidimicrobiales bacterium]